MVAGGTRGGLGADCCLGYSRVGVAVTGTFAVFTLQERTKDAVRNTSVRHKMRRMGLTHVARLLGLEESECMILEAWVPPTPGTNGDVLFFAIWCLLLKVNKKSPQKSVNIRGKGSCSHLNPILSNSGWMDYQSLHFPLKSTVSGFTLMEVSAVLCCPPVV